VPSTRYSAFSAIPTLAAILAQDAQLLSHCSDVTAAPLAYAVREGNWQIEGIHPVTTALRAGAGL
jgi:hypothetical protein